MLDDFSSTNIAEANNNLEYEQVRNESRGAQPSDPNSQSNNDAAADISNPNEDDFAKQLQAGMAEMMRELESNPDMAKQFEELMGGQLSDINNESANHGIIEEAKSLSGDNAGSAASVGESTSTPGPSFQDSIKRTMDRMRQSNESASAANAPPGKGSEEDFMTQMLNEIAQGGGGGEGNPEDAFSNMLLGMMEQLTNKEILYEPMKELDAKFPAWLSEREPGSSKESTITEDARSKYKEQQVLVHEIVQRFEKPNYSDQNSQDREFIVEKMQKMQAAGAPPSDLVGDMGAASEMLVRFSITFPKSIFAYAPIGWFRLSMSSAMKKAKRKNAFL